MAASHVVTRGTVRSQNGSLRADQFNPNSVYAAYLDSLLTMTSEKIPGEVFPVR
ncbi:MAG: hypothetical protein AAF938_23545 [Myxococcota bacterium]